jgi:hypothetical protein
MSRHPWFSTSLSALVLLGLAGIGAGGGDAPKKGGTVSGIVFDKEEKTLKLKVKIDGEEEPATFLVDAADKKLAKSLQLIFSVARVRLTYKWNGDNRQLVSIDKTGTKGQGSITGTVLATHKYWLEVRPKNGPPEGYCATYPKEVWDATEAKIGQLQKGDTVTIRYYTDIERHRIQSIQKVSK